ncbi:MAG: DNA-processing protein DprA [Solirubrobacterales bacterium]
MRTSEGNMGPSAACASCLRRSWLLAELSASLDYSAGDRVRLMELLELGDGELMQALGGRRRAELKARHAQLDTAEICPIEGVEAVCRHDRRYPRTLSGAGAPPMLNVAGGLARLREMTAGPVVAIAGSRRASDYGVEMAKSLARGLAASGVTVTSGLADGISAAAQAGALEVPGRSLAVIAGGVDVGCPAKRRSMYARVIRGGCAVAELPCGSPARRWGHPASERIVASLASVTVLVEAEEIAHELLGAQLALARGRTVAAVPGRVTSPLSRGPHALLVGGAHLVRGPADVLELLDDVEAPALEGIGATRPELEPRLRSVLEKVGAGRDTPDKLTASREDATKVLLALTELELMGLLGRGDGGRYVPRDASWSCALPTERRHG